MDDITAAEFQNLLDSNPHSLIDRGAHMSAHDARAAVFVGRAHLRLKDYRAAGADFRQAMHLDPTYPAAAWYAGVVAERLGRLAEAAEHYHRVLELDPGFPAARAKLGLDQGRTDRAASATAGSPRNTESKAPMRSQLWLPQVDEVREYEDRLTAAKKAEFNATIKGVPTWYKFVFGIFFAGVVIFIAWTLVNGIVSFNERALDHCKFILENFGADDLDRECRRLLGMSR